MSNSSKNKQNSFLNKAKKLFDQAEDFVGDKLDDFDKSDMKKKT